MGVGGGHLLVIKEKNSYCQSICSICYLEISRDSQVFRSYRLGIELKVCVCVCAEPSEAWKYLSGFSPSHMASRQVSLSQSHGCPAPMLRPS